MTHQLYKHRWVAAWVVAVGAEWQWGGGRPGLGGQRRFQEAGVTISGGLGAE